MFSGCGEEIFGNVDHRYQSCTVNGNEVECDAVEGLCCC